MSVHAPGGDAAAGVCRLLSTTSVGHVILASAPDSCDAFSAARRLTNPRDPQRRIGDALRTVARRRHRGVTLVLLGLSLVARPSLGQSPPRSAATEEADPINPDRPGIADGSRVISRGQVQAEVGLQQEYRREAGSRTRTDFTPTLLRFGVVRRVEVRIESNFASWMRESGDGASPTRTSGYAPGSIGLKYQIFDSHGEHRRSVGTIVRLFPPSGSRAFASHSYDGDVRLAGDWDFAPKLSVNPNVGAARLEDGERRTFVAALGALTLNYLPTAALNPFVDLGYQSREMKHGQSALVVDAGIAYIVGANLQLDVSVGRGVHGTTPPHPFIAAGFSVRASPLGHG
jgi:Putative MetA-pathway of phenol degradation